MTGNIVIVVILLTLILTIIIGAYLFSVWWSRHFRDRSVRRREDGHRLVTLTRSNVRAADENRWVEVRVREPGRRTSKQTKPPQQATQNPASWPQHERVEQHQHHQQTQQPVPERRVESRNNNDTHWLAYANGNNDEQDNQPPATFHPSPAAAPASPQHGNNWEQEPWPTSPAQDPNRTQKVEDLRSSLQQVFAENRNSKAGSKAGSKNEWPGYGDNINKHDNNNNYYYGGNNDNTANDDAGQW
ncbi:uncharacterized protein BP01DRAFT_400385 [Aspergillus saccharolyticus JOP 1030-1]|uniref:Uncharacterized protein n=1 Tax=Aspergillus saccharolyticus JOP 1030-1 TaxID=1450539 RepID=A0A318ZR70_9EURO|nr:hypothetical protein BP01DRAFT_400385 [Aspergillus saccharolyticus JOP 1030-1]PYH49145.1 hypothetical protein BP01DRAFT_400385 [Aspergillus saccharolyticus JOP 1030-1]